MRGRRAPLGGCTAYVLESCRRTCWRHQFSFCAQLRVPSTARAIVTQHKFDLRFEPRFCSARAYRFLPIPLRGSLARGSLLRAATLYRDLLGVDLLRAARSAWAAHPRATVPLRCASMIARGHSLCTPLTRVRGSGVWARSDRVYKQSAHAGSRWHIPEHSRESRGQRRSVNTIFVIRSSWKFRGTKGAVRARVQ